MGKTYRKEKPAYKKAREDEVAHKRVDHGHERTAARRQLQEARQSWTEESDMTGVEDCRVMEDDNGFGEG